MDRDAGDSPPRPDPPRRDRVATDVPIPGAVGAGAAFCVGTVLVALRWLTGIQLGGPGLVLKCAAVAWIVGARLAARSHENSQRRSTGTRPKAQDQRTTSRGARASPKVVSCALSDCDTAYRVTDRAELDAWAREHWLTAHPWAVRVRVVHVID